MQLSPSLSLSVAPRQNIYNIFWCTVQRFLIKSLPYLIYLFYQVLNLFHHLSIHFFHSLIFEKYTNELHILCSLSLQKVEISYRN